MRADTWGFRFWNLLIAGIISGALWWVFQAHLPHVFFLVPLFYIMHVRDLKSRLRELNDRQRLQFEMFTTLVNDEGFINVFYDLLDQYGFSDEADALFEKEKDGCNAGLS